MSVLNRMNDETKLGCKYLGMYTTVAPLEETRRIAKNLIEFSTLTLLRNNHILCKTKSNYVLFSVACLEKLNADTLN